MEHSVWYSPPFLPTLIPSPPSPLYRAKYQRNEITKVLGCTILLTHSFRSTFLDNIFVLALRRRNSPSLRNSPSAPRERYTEGDDITGASLSLTYDSLFPSGPASRFRRPSKSLDPTFSLFKRIFLRINSKVLIDRLIDANGSVLFTSPVVNTWELSTMSDEYMCMYVCEWRID